MNLEIWYSSSDILPIKKALEYFKNTEINQKSIPKLHT